MTIGELASHNHSASINSTGGHSHTLGRGSNSSVKNIIPEYYDTGHWLVNGGTNVGTTSSAGSHSHTITINSTGSNTAHNNIQPYLAVYYWKRTA